jgi:NAD(P)-dependent dehydrogenase (short-subunit alcohol dehydrogenase family)
LEVTADFTGKRALVTGAGGGIGREIALALAARGAAVAVADLDAGRAGQVAAEIAGKGGSGRALALNVADAGAVVDRANELIDAWGGIDLLVNNAGISLMKSFLETTRTELQAQLDVNLGGTWNLCQAVLPAMIRQGDGAVVNMSSWSGKTGRALNAAYGVAKFGIIGLTETLAHEMGPHGIRVNAICPGLIVGTDMRSQTEREMQSLGMPSTEQRIQTIPMRRAGTPLDVANLACFLLSTDASYITGESFNVTGGLWMG